MKSSRIDRREFLKRTSLAGGACVAGDALDPRTWEQTAVASPGAEVTIVLSPEDAVASSAPATWAASELEQTLKARGIAVRRRERIQDAASAGPSIFVASASYPPASEMLAQAKVEPPTAPEAFALARIHASGSSVILACGGDPRGLVYALLELADRVQYAPAPLAALELRKPVVEKPLNPIRSVNRCFESVVEDKPWFYDRAMWPKYLSMLAAQRFNRFSLTFGLGYDFPRHIRDAYFYFAYPFLVSPSGFNVRAVGLPDEERDRNLETLRFASDQAAARGLDFQLGLWTHAYEWLDSPDANYTIEGLSPANHAAYCRDALRSLLVACPSINGVTLRIHGESGVPEGSYDFWKTVFDGVAQSGRRVELNLHAKGIDERMIDLALATGLPVTVSPKYWAEHLGLSYQPASIRELEMPHPDKKTRAYFELSEGTRSFMRYSYGDLLKEDRKYGIFWRVFPGTQRVLLWGSPAMAAADSRAGNFCGGLGMDLFEPLSFKGRHGSGLPGGRCAYADASLNPQYDWEKFLYTYRVWGRHLYHPNADPDGWRRFLNSEFQTAAPNAENALAHASRILRLVTAAHLPSAANNNYWPEIYTNMPVVDAAKNHLYTDTPPPKVFGAVSPLDPELFSTIEDFAEDIVNGRQSGKTSPAEVAQWLEDLANTAARHLTSAEAMSGRAKSAPLRRLTADVLIQCGLGRFFAWKLRSGVLFALYQQTNQLAALEQAVAAYRRARASWAEVANHAKGLYMLDITYGIEPNLRGNWLDRLPQFDDDIADMQKLLDQAKSSSPGNDDAVNQAIREVLAPPARPALPLRHKPPERFQPGKPLEINLELERAGRLDQGLTARLNYRHANQSGYYRSVEMVEAKGRFDASIPGDYTQSPYALQYYFELRFGPRRAWLYPGFGIDLSGQPYYVVRSV